MVKLIRTERKSALLTPSSLACLSRNPTVNLTMGCAHGCLYCYTRGYRKYPGEAAVVMYENVMELLRDELQRKRRKPLSIYFSPASDLFQPVPEVLDLAYDVLKEILSRGIGVAFLTKGIIPDRHMSLFRENAVLVRAQIGLITLDDAVLRMFEPNAASAADRLAQMKQLTKSGIKTQMRIDPILPALTDDEQTLRRLCESATCVGVTDVASSVLFLRHAPMRRLLHAAKTSAAVASCLGAFSNSQKLAIHAERSSVTALPVQERELIFQRLENIAASYGMKVKRCACKNPDIATGTCSIAVGWQRKCPKTEATLFD